MLLPNRSAAQAFFTEVYPHNTNCLIVTADHSYPEDSELRDLCLRALEANPQALVVVINAECLAKVRVVSERILILDEYLSQDYRSESEDRELGFQFDREKLANFIETFFRQWDKISGDGNHSFHYRGSVQFCWKEQWPLKLLVGDS